MTQKISRAQWEQIRKRVQLLTDFVFDPSWKCLICNVPWNRCTLHDEEDMTSIIAQVRERFGI